MSCEPCSNTKKWNMEELSATAYKSGISNLSEDEIDDRLQACNLCPHRDNQTCTKNQQLILTWILNRQNCPEGFWEELKPVLETHNGWFVDDNGNITHEIGVTVPNPCGDCIHRRANVVWIIPPRVSPHCTLYKRNVTWDECCSCEDRQ